MPRPSNVPWRMRLSLHGWPGVSLDGREVPLGLRYGAALLACLALEARRIARVQLATLLWPGADDATGRSRLRRLVYRVNALCGAAVVAGDGEALWLDPRVRLECDVLQAQAQARALLAPLPEGLPPVPVDALLAAGSHLLLDGFSIDAQAFQEWVAQQRDAHERLVAHALQRLAERSIATGDIALALRAGERLVALDPLAERGYATLMVALGHLGDAAAIEAAYFRCAGLLRGEYGVAPSAVVETAYASASAMARARPPTAAEEAAGAAAGTAAMAPAILRTRSRDGVDLAYTVAGEGRTVIKASNWLSHLEYDRGSPVWGHMVGELSRHFSYVCYDERGCGLSGWDAPDLSFARWVDDLDAVVDAVGAQRFALLGISQGASIAIAYAVRHPERVERLVVHGGYARGRLVRSDTPQERDEAETMCKLAELGWGKDEPSFRQFFTSQFIPDGTPAQHAWFNELERISTSPANAARFMREFARIDVVDLLPQVRCPTLVLHSLEDVRVPIAEGQLIADRIPGARFVPVHSRNHLLLAHEAGWPHWWEEVRAFLAA